jgi:putative flavoprotein involved in K+ transport
MADYLEAYARRFELPVRSGVRVNRLTRVGNRYLIEAGSSRFEADHVVVAMSSYQVPRVPAFAKELGAGILQMHSSEYRNLGQLKPGAVLLVGAGNSGAEIAIEVAREHPTSVSGRDTGHVPFKIDGLPARIGLLRLLFRFVFHRVLTVGTPMGRRLRRKMFTQGAPLIRVKPKHLAAAGVQRVSKVSGVLNGLPVLDDGRALEVTNVIWCTGFGNGLSWIDLPIFEANGEPRHRSGVASDEPGLYFVGLHFLHSLSSTMIHGVARDAKRITDAIERRTKEAEVSRGTVTSPGQFSTAGS